MTDIRQVLRSLSVHTVVHHGGELVRDCKEKSVGKSNIRNNRNCKNFILRPCASGHAFQLYNHTNFCINI